MIEHKLEEYKTVSDARLDEFDRIINELLKEGWALFGTPYVVTNDHGVGMRHQALVKYKSYVKTY